MKPLAFPHKQKADNKKYLILSKYSPFVFGLMQMMTENKTQYDERKNKIQMIESAIRNDF